MSCQIHPETNYHSQALLDTEKVPQRTFATKISPNFRVNFLVRFASKPMFYWVNGPVTPSNRSENSLALFVRFFGFGVLFGLLTLTPRVNCRKRGGFPAEKGTFGRSRFLGRGCDEALFTQKKQRFFSEVGGGNSVNEGFGKDFYRKGNSVKRFGPFTERRTLKTEKLLSSSPSTENRLLFGGAHSKKPLEIAEGFQGSRIKSASQLSQDRFLVDDENVGSWKTARLFVGPHCVTLPAVVAHLPIVVLVTVESYAVFRLEVACRIKNISYSSLWSMETAP